MEKQFTYIFNGEEKSKEQFTKLAKDSFKWFSNSSINAVDFDSISNFFNGGYKSNSEINKHFKGILENHEKSGKDFMGEEKRMWDMLTPVLKVNLTKEDLPPHNETLKDWCNEKDDVIPNNSRGEKEMMSYYQTAVGIKESQGKLDYSEINFRLLDLMAKRFMDNKVKYPKGNSKKVLDKNEILWAAFRHIRKMVQPIENDPETYEEHLAAVATNLSIILDQLDLEKSK